MKKILKVGRRLTALEQKSIIGGYEPLADCTKDCGNNITVTCTGAYCSTTEHGCNTSSTNSNNETVFDFKPCPSS